MPVRTLTFTETVAGLTYTAVTSVPKGARILDVLVEASAQWAAATALLDVGDSDAADALLSNVDVGLQTAVFTAGYCSYTDWGGGGNGLPYSDIAVTGGAGKLYPAGDTITAVITATVPGGPTGSTRVTIWYEIAGAHRVATVV